MTPPATCPVCGGRMEYFGPDDPRQDDGTTETYICEDCDHEATWYPEDDQTRASFHGDFRWLDDWFAQQEGHDDYNDEATP